MKILNPKNEIERKISIYCILSDAYLQRFSLIYRKKFISGDLAKTVIDWCLDFFTKYNHAPGKEIQSIYEKHESKLSPDLYDSIGAFLESISDESKSDATNIEYLYEETIRYFQKQALSDLATNLEGLVIEEKTDEALSLLSDFAVIDDKIGYGQELFESEEFIDETLNDEDDDALIKYPGALGMMLNSQFTRGSFVSLLAPEKTGKTFWLMEFFIRACWQRRNAALIQIGDMSKKQIVKRIAVHLAKRHFNSKHCGDVKIPIMDCYFNQTNQCRLKKRKCRTGIILDADSGETLDFDEATESGYTVCAACRGSGRHFPAVWYRKAHITPLGSREELKPFWRRIKRRMKGKRAKLFCVPSITSKELLSILKIWEKQEDFVPDVLVLDYIDEIQADGRMDFRQGINKVWSDIRGYTLEKNNLVITASQADSKSYGLERITRKNFSEDKRKLAHVTAMYALNQTEDEKRKGVMRIAPIVEREDDSINEVSVLYSFKIARPFLDSFVDKKRKEEKEDDQAN